MEIMKSVIIMMVYIFSKKFMVLKNRAKQMSIASVRRIVVSMFLFL